MIEFMEKLGWCTVFQEIGTTFIKRKSNDDLSDTSESFYPSVQPARLVQTSDDVVTRTETQQV